MVETLEARQLAVLEWFVYRARRVSEHSLCKDREPLLRLAQGQFQVEFEPTPDGQQRMWVVRNLPAEESMESLAARCRPFILKGDPVHYPKPLQALGFFVHGCGELQERVNESKRRWSRLRKDNPEPLGYTSRVGPDPSLLGQETTDRSLAYRWLYGDVVHADDLREFDHDITARYAAGVMLTSKVAIESLLLLDLVREAVNQRLAPLNHSVFEDPVLAETCKKNEAVLMLGPVGTGRAILEEAMAEALRHHRWSSPQSPGM